ncbi:MAG: FmdB family zinc ribbon protein [Dehalococcoidia bacterium]
MPLYEYYCPTCRETFELLRPMRAAAKAVPCAKGHKTERVMSLVASGPWQSGGAAGEMAGGCACGGSCSCGG